MTQLLPPELPGTCFKDHDFISGLYIEVYITSHVLAVKKTVTSRDCEEY